jgi:cell division protein FtsQ
VSDNSGQGIEPGESFESVRIIKPPRDEPPTEPAVDEVVVDQAVLDEPVTGESMLDVGDDIPTPAWLTADTDTDTTVLDDAMATGEIEIANGPHHDDTTEIPVVPGGPSELPSITITEPKRRQVILIDDDQAAEAVPDGSVAADVDRVDPRIRARRRAVQRAAGLRRFRLLIAIASVLTLVVGGSILIQSPLFSVKEVNVTGVHYTDAAAVQAVADSLRGQPLYRADLGKAQDELLLQPWVRRARIVRTWPRSVTIDIAERTPVAAVQSEDSQWRVIDVEGRVLALTLGKPKDFMEVKGDPALVAVGETVSAPMISGARLAEMLPGRLKAVTARVIVGGDGAVALDITPRGKILLGTIDDLRAKLISVLTYMDACPGVEFDYMDARAADSLVLTPPSCPKTALTKKVP